MTRVPPVLSRQSNLNLMCQDTGADVYDSTPFQRKKSKTVTISPSVGLGVGTFDDLDRGRDSRRRYGAVVSY